MSWNRAKCAAWAFGAGFGACVMLTRILTNDATWHTYLGLVFVPAMMIWALSDN